MVEALYFLLIYDPEEVDEEEVIPSLFIANYIMCTKSDDFYSTELLEEVISSLRDSHQIDSELADQISDYDNIDVILAKLRELYQVVELIKIS